MSSSNVNINHTTVHEQANRAPGATIYCPGPLATTQEGRARNLQLGIVAAALTAAVAAQQSTIQSPINIQQSNATTCRSSAIAICTVQSPPARKATASTSATAPTKATSSK